MNIVLIGYRGTGKTSVGKELSKRLRREFIDVDELIELKCGEHIKNIFSKKGETAFRVVESGIIEELSKADGKVLSCGGGAVLWYKNIKNLKKNGFVVLLEASVDVIYNRLSKDPKTLTQRPHLINNASLYDEIVSETSLRKPYYEQASDLVINTSEKDINTVTIEIIEHLKEKIID